MSAYKKPEIKTLTVSQILETMGPVSCGSGRALGTATSTSTSISATPGLEHLD
jgi:hypothetical protein